MCVSIFGGLFSSTFVVLNNLYCHPPGGCVRMRMSVIYIYRFRVLFDAFAMAGHHENAAELSKHIEDKTGAKYMQQKQTHTHNSYQLFFKYKKKFDYLLFLRGGKKKKKADVSS